MVVFLSLSWRGAPCLPWRRRCPCQLTVSLSGGLHIVYSVGDVPVLCQHSVFFQIYRPDGEQVEKRRDEVAPNKCPPPPLLLLVLAKGDATSRGRDAQSHSDTANMGTETSMHLFSPLLWGGTKRCPPPPSCCLCWDRLLHQIKLCIKLNSNHHPKVSTDHKERTTAPPPKDEEEGKMPSILWLEQLHHVSFWRRKTPPPKRGWCGWWCVPFLLLLWVAEPPPLFFGWCCLLLILLWVGGAFSASS